MPIVDVLNEMRQSKVGIFMGDIALSPRYNKAVNMKIFEYMTQAIPVIINRLDMLSELVIKSEAGWIIDFDDEELYRLLKTIKDNDNLLTERGVNGFNFLLQNELWENQEPTLYEAILESQ